MQPPKVNDACEELALTFWYLWMQVINQSYTNFDQSKFLILSTSTKAPKYFVLGCVLELGQRNVERATIRKHLNVWSLLRFSLSNSLPKNLIEGSVAWSNNWSKELFPQSLSALISIPPIGIPNTIWTENGLTGITFPSTTMSELEISTWSAIHWAKYLGTEQSSNFKREEKPNCSIASLLDWLRPLRISAKYEVLHLLNALRTLASLEHFLDSTLRLYKIEYNICFMKIEKTKKGHIMQCYPNFPRR